MKSITDFGVSGQYWRFLTTAQHGNKGLRFTTAAIFIWFGVLKPLGMSPAEDLIALTIHWFPANWFIPFLGIWEVAIGVLMIFPKTVRPALILMFLHIPGTFLPMVMVPEKAFTQFPFGLTLEGQYIVKNLTLIAAAIAIALQKCPEYYQRSRAGAYSGTPPRTLATN